MKLQRSINYGRVVVDLVKDPVRRVLDLVKDHCRQGSLTRSTTFAIFARSLFSVIILLATCLPYHTAVATDAPAEEDIAARTTVGMAEIMEAVVLPGDVLVVKDIEDRHQPFIVRIVDTYKHGTDHRYDIEFYALEPGKYNLTDYLVREDGSPAEQLPALWVDVASTLTAGQILPNDPETANLPSLGGYWLMWIVGGILWIAGLVALVMVGRRKALANNTSTVKQVTMAEHLRPLVQAAIRGELDSSGRAELERSLIAYWCNRLNLHDLEPGEVISRLRNDSQAGPLITSLEDWLHRPEPPANVDIEALLEPYKDIRDESFNGSTNENSVASPKLATAGAGGSA